MKTRWYKNIGLFFDKSFSKGIVKQLLWLVGIMLVVYVILVALSYSGWFYSTNEDGAQGRWFDVLFVLIDPGRGDETMKSPFAILCSILGLAVFGGMLISVISNILNLRVESYTKGETDYKVSDHVIILGYNRSVPSLLNVIYEKHGDGYIILMSERDSEDIRDRIHAHVKTEIANNLIIMNGIRTAIDDLERLRLGHNPKEIYIIGEENEGAHDTNSLDCVKKMSQMLTDGKVDCHVQIDSYTMFSTMQSVDFGDTLLENGEAIKKHLNLHPFNFNEIWAQKALATIPQKVSIDGENTYQYYPLDGEGIGVDSKCHVHLILLGMNDMSISLAVNAAHILHFPNFVDGDFSTCSTITFIDPNADVQGRSMRNQYHHLFNLARWRSIDASKANDPMSGWIDSIGDENSEFKHLGAKNFMDIQWEFIKGDVDEQAVQDYLATSSDNVSEITTIAICFDNSERNAALCRALPDAVSIHANSILVRQKESSVTIDLIRRISPHNKRIRAFGMMDDCYGENLATDKYGKLINACYCGIDINNLLTPEWQSTQNEIDEKWEGCSITDKWSSNYSANMLFTKLRSLGFSDDNQITKQHIEEILKSVSVQDAIQKTEHNRWNTEKLLMGFVPLTKEEQDLFLPFQDQKDALKAMKAQWKNQEKKHLDICSNDVLKTIDKWSVGFDNHVNSKLWTLYQMIKE